MPASRLTDWDSATCQSTMHLTASKAGLLTQPSIWHWRMCDHAPSLHQNLRRYPFHLRCFLIRRLNLQALSIWFAMRRRIASIWAIWRMSASSCFVTRTPCIFSPFQVLVTIWSAWGAPCFAVNLSRGMKELFGFVHALATNLDSPVAIWAVGCPTSSERLGILLTSCMCWWCYRDK